MSRSAQKEWMETGECTEEEHREALRQLGRIGKLTGGNRATLSAFERLEEPPRSILDVGCGGGQFATLLAERYPEAEVVGIDLDPIAIAYATEKTPELPNLRFQLVEDKELGGEDHRYDVVTATLVCHHFGDSELKTFVRDARRVARQRVILNDLVRSPIALATYAVSAPLLFHNRLILHDGLVSIRRGFTRNDWKRLLGEEAKLSRHPLFRWIVEITP